MELRNGTRPPGLGTGGCSGGAAHRGSDGGDHLAGRLDEWSLLGDLDAAMITGIASVKVREGGAEDEETSSENNDDNDWRVC